MRGLGLGKSGEARLRVTQLRMRRSEQGKKPGLEDASASRAACGGPVADLGEAARVVLLSDQGRAEQDIAERYVEDKAPLRVELEGRLCEFVGALGLAPQQANPGSEDQRRAEIARKG